MTDKKDSNQGNKVYRIKGKDAAELISLAKKFPSNEYYWSNEGLDELLTKKLTSLVDVYENTADPKQRYKLESQICRLVDRIGRNEEVIIYNKSGAYMPALKRDGEYRIPDWTNIFSQDGLNKLISNAIRYVALENYNKTLELNPTNYDGGLKGVKK
jgi:hypothetical protein